MIVEEHAETFHAQLVSAKYVRHAVNFQELADHARTESISGAPAEEAQEGIAGGKTVGWTHRGEMAKSSLS